LGSNLRRISQFKNLFHSSFLRAVLGQSPFVAFGIRRHHAVISQFYRLGQFRQFHGAQSPPQIQRHVPPRVAILIPKFSPLAPFDLLNRRYDRRKRRPLRHQAPGPALLLAITNDLLPQSPQDPDVSPIRLTDEHLDKIVRTCRKFETVDKYACRATPQEIADNDFNLNIPRYVDTFEEEEEIDMDEVKQEIIRLEGELAAVRKKMEGYLNELAL
jgi:hypothetical protein